MALDKNDGKVLVNSRQDIKVLLSGLWVVLMFLYVYCDILSLFKSGAISRMMDGFMGPFQVNQMTLLSASLLMILPACMVFLSLCLKAKLNRWLNIIAGSAYTLVGIGNVIGESCIYYIVFVTLEMVVTVSIVALSIKWPRRQDGFK
jgi:hypothetical protein